MRNLFESVNKDVTIPGAGGNLPVNRPASDTQNPKNGHPIHSRTEHRRKPKRLCAC